MPLALAVGKVWDGAHPTSRDSVRERTLGHFHFVWGRAPHRGVRCYTGWASRWKALWLFHMSEIQTEMTGPWSA